jgi:hypothetical protein
MELERARIVQFPTVVVTFIVLTAICAVPAQAQDKSITPDRNSRRIAELTGFGQKV